MLSDKYELNAVWPEGNAMWEKLRGKIKGSVRFPKRSTGDLNSLKNFWLVFGLVWMFLGFFGRPGWASVGFILFGLGMILQFGLAVKEVRRRRAEGSPKGPAV
jgi:Flp pilus assembly protein TadB